ncbi:MAG: serine/threonine protein kinase [Planctomycetes bacterium]|nr:serine/threonine protein kinase [Planctomycetota bacterium]
MADPARVKAIFIAALDRAESERASFVIRECGADVAVRREVEALLAAHLGNELLAADTIPSDPQTMPQAQPDERAGTRIGPYKLLQLIGEGGFGSVFMAEQEHPVRRRVALKIIKLGMDTRQVVARFEQERQALAMMDHPHVAKVLDAGATENGRPYFVMELVNGVPITKYCDMNGLTATQRLELFVSVCHAVQHAHQKGIIHRDIKPSNVLVTLHDGKPVPKVIDFGIAKAIDNRLTEKTLFTEFGQFLGTPTYMSPEQAEMSGLHIDTRSDIYSLGVLLYELLTGTTPFDVKSLLSAGFAEIQRIIREVQPPKPSTRVSTLGDSLPSVAAHRSTEPRKLGALIRGDLDWIAMKCLEKDRTRRYESASSLAMDVERHLAGEAVVAAPPSASYRMRKFVTRHRGPVLVAVLFTAALVLGLAGTIVGLVQAQRAREGEAVKRHEAEIERDKAQKIAAFEEQTLKGVGPSVALGRDTTLLREMMDEAARRIEQGALSDNPEAEVQLRLTIGETYRIVAAYPAAEAALAPALALARKTFGDDSAWAAYAIHLQASVSFDQGRPDTALPQFEAALAMRQRLFTGDHPFIAESMNAVALCLHALGRPNEALPQYEAALAMRQRLFKGDDAQIAMSLSNVGDCLLDLGRGREATPKHEAAVAMTRRIHHGDHPDVASAINNLANDYRAAGRTADALPKFEEALAMFQRLCPRDHPDVARTLSNVASCLQDLGRAEEALPKHEAALAMLQHLHPGDHPDVAHAMVNVAGCLRALGRDENALAQVEAALAMNRRGFQSDHPDIVRCLNTAADLLDALGRRDEADGRRRESLAMQRRLLPPESPGLSSALVQFAIARLKAGTPQAAGEAEPILRECLAIRTHLFPDGHAQQWLNYNTMSLLGESLVVEASDPTMPADARVVKLREAEPLLVNAFTKLDGDPDVPSPAQVGADRKREALERVVKLYEALEQAEPGKGHDADAERWRAKRK